jgi:hypothetical protein
VSILAGEENIEDCVEIQATGRDKHIFILVPTNTPASAPNPETEQNRIKYPPSSSKPLNHNIILPG